GLNSPSADIDLLYFIADHPNILSLAKTCWTTLYFLGLAPAEHQPLERWGKGDSQSGLYNGNKASTADLLGDQIGCRETPHATTENANDRFRRQFALRLAGLAPLA